LVAHTAHVASSAVASVVVYVVGARTSVQTGSGRTLVDIMGAVLIARGVGISSSTGAGVGVDAVSTGSAVETRCRMTLIDIDGAVESRPARRTITRVGSN
jgi:hypothetical protein